LQVVCSIVGGDTYYEQIYDSFAATGSTLHGYVGNVDDEYELIDSGMLLALIFYLKYEAPEDEQNFPMVMELLRAGEVREDNDECERNHYDRCIWGYRRNY